MVHRRCPKCTLMPPCSHYESSEKIAMDAQKVMNSEKFRETLSPAKRNTLLKMVKSQPMTHMQNSMILPTDNDNSYYIDTL